MKKLLLIEWTSETFMYFVGILVVAVVAMYFLYRWIFSIEEQLSNQKKQIQLLQKIAEMQGVSEHEIDVIINPVKP